MRLRDAMDEFTTSDGAKAIRAQLFRNNTSLNEPAADSLLNAFARWLVAGAQLDSGLHMMLPGELHSSVLHPAISYDTISPDFTTSFATLVAGVRGVPVESVVVTYRELTPKEASSIDQNTVDNTISRMALLSGKLPAELIDWPNIAAGGDWKTGCCYWNGTPRNAGRAITIGDVLFVH